MSPVIGRDPSGSRTAVEPCGCCFRRPSWTPASRNETRNGRALARPSQCLAMSLSCGLCDQAGRLAVRVLHVGRIAVEDVGAGAAEDAVAGPGGVAGLELVVARSAAEHVDYGVDRDRLERVVAGPA